MTKDTTYKEKFAMLKSWVPEIVSAIKKDLRNDHLRRDPVFCKRYFPGKTITKLTPEELAHGYSKALEESEAADAVGDFMANRWLLKNGEIYNYFVTRLSQVNPNFTEIEQLDPKVSHEIINDGVSQFCARDIYLFSILNAVAFNEDVLAELGDRAKKEQKEHKKNEESVEVERSIEKLISEHQMQLARTVDKYEKRLQGMEKKYHHDVEALKKQISRLQKQM